MGTGITCSNSWDQGSAAASCYTHAWMQDTDMLCNKPACCPSSISATCHVCNHASASCIYEQYRCRATFRLSTAANNYNRRPSDDYRSLSNQPLTQHFNQARSRYCGPGHQTSEPFVMRNRHQAKASGSPKSSGSTAACFCARGPTAETLRQRAHSFSFSSRGKLRLCRNWGMLGPALWTVSRRRPFSEVSMPVPSSSESPMAAQHSRT